MSNYRRYFVAGGTFFFTLKTEGNAPLFSDKANVDALGMLMRELKEKWPFEINAMVLLPDHLHTIWTLPPSDNAYPKRWGWLKKEFTKCYLASGGEEQPRSKSRRGSRRRGVWQRKYWEHTIEDEDDFAAHFDYIHWNPVKHGYVKSPSHWPYSSIHRWINAGVYSADWGRGEFEPASVSRIMHAGE